MRIKKIRFKKNAIELEWLVRSGDEGNNFDEYKLRCKDECLPEFEKAMQAMSPHVVEMCELPTAWSESLLIGGVTFSYSNDIMAATIVARRELANSPTPLNFATPHKPEVPYAEGGDESKCLSEECVEALKRVCAEATRYISGERLGVQQPSLFPAVDADTTPQQQPLAGVLQDAVLENNGVTAARPKRSRRADAAEQVAQAAPA